MIQFVFNQKVSGSLAGTSFQFICKNFTLDADMPYASYTFNVIYNITCDGLNAFIEEKVIYLTFVATEEFYCLHFINYILTIMMNTLLLVATI